MEIFGLASEYREVPRGNS
jgi:hypothetical protein